MVCVTAGCVRRRQQQQPRRRLRCGRETDAVWCGQRARRTTQQSERRRHWTSCGQGSDCAETAPRLMFVHTQSFLHADYTDQPVCLRAPAVTNWMILSEQRFHLLTVTASKAFGWEKTLEFSAPSAYSLLPNSRRQPDPTKLSRRSAVRIEQLLGRVQTSNFPYATVLNSHWESKSHRRCDSSVGSSLVMWIRQTLLTVWTAIFCSTVVYDSVLWF